MSLSQFITNKVMGIDDTLEDSYTYSDKDSKYIGILFIVGILLEILTRLNIRSLKTVLGNIYWILVAVYGGIALLLMVIISTMKRENILKKREDLIQVYEILQKLVDKKGEGLDFNNVPFELGYKYGEIQKISVQVDPVSFTGGDKLLIPIVGQLDNFLPTFKWNYSTSRLNERILEFIGEDKPPTIARWPGSWLRYFRFMPMGIAGKGEVGFKPDSIPKGEEGRSQFIDENGNPIPGILDMPNAPQGMVSGAPLGLDTIIPTTKGYKTMETIAIGDEVFDINNKPVKVLGKSEVNYNPDKVYKLEFLSHSFHPESITVISDSIHRFPKVVGDHQWSMTTAEELKVGDNVLTNKDYCYGLYKKEEIEKQPVQCILVDSDEHLFLITDESHMYKEWKGGNSYPYEAVYTRNTGGGKAIWVEQEIEE